MEPILQSLLELAGVNATVVIDEAGRVLGHRGRAVYDLALCEQVSLTLARVVDSFQLQHPDWESIAAQFADGKLLVRNLGVLPPHGPCVLVVVADGDLNLSFATVSIRVAANKLKRLAEGGGRTPTPTAPPAPWASSPPSSPIPLPPASSSGVRPPPSAPPRPTPLLGSAGPDPVAAAYLVRCARELARYVGPMARIFIDEAVRRVSPGQPFTMAGAQALLQDVAGQIEDLAGRATFLAAMRAPRPP
jgi:hypothetical protein